MRISFNPIGSWYVVALAALVVTALTIWAYRRRLRGSQGRWRWVALGLRLAAVLLCLLAALRPSVILQEKKKDPAAIVFLIDASRSMTFGDEVRGQKRWEVASKTMDEALAAAKKLGGDLEVKAYRFDIAVRDYKPEDKAPPEGSETGLGTVLLDALQRQSGTRVATIVLLSDGANNAGVPPLVAARRLRSQQVPVVTVGYGAENAGPSSKDIAIRDVVTAPTVFVKNQLQVRGTLLVRGFQNQPIDVEMYVEGQALPVATQQVKAPEGTELVPLEGLKYIPQTSGEKRITIKVKPKEGELIQTNNVYTTYVTVLKGGLNVLYIQGPNFTWEYKFLIRSLDASPDIQSDLKVLKRPAQGDRSEIEDKEFVPGRYDVYILGDLPADHLTRTQQKLLTNAIEQGAGLIMLGGRSSFGAGGWASSELARVLPTRVHPGDGQFEPPDGVKFVPNAFGLDSYLLQVGPNRTETARIWSVLPPLTGINQLGEPKPGANIIAEASGPRPEPVMVGMETAKGRVLAFGGETWVWARASDEGRNAHRKFWRQVIFWLAHKENEGENQVKIALDRRRLPVGQKLDMTVVARDAKGLPIKDIQYEAKVSVETPNTPETPLDLFTQGDEAKGSYFAVGQPGECKVTVRATRNGQEIGRDSARFIVYQDDRELENPAADLALLRQIAETTGGVSLPPEQLGTHLGTLNGKIYTERVSQIEHKIWDNWPFLLLFTALLTLEWWLRKRHGWV